MVVATGAPSASASRASSDSAPEMITPPPTITRGFAASASRRADRSTSAGSGATRRDGKTPSVASAQTSSASTAPFCTSNGTHTWAAPGRPVVMWVNAARSTRGTSAARSSTAFHLVSGRIRPRWSSSVRA